jgi:hypothetical protein
MRYSSIVLCRLFYECPRSVDFDFANADRREPYIRRFRAIRDGRKVTGKELLAAADGGEIDLIAIADGQVARATTPGGISGTPQGLPGRRPA